MTIEQSDKIDVIGRDKEDGYIALTISDHLEWDESNEKLPILQAKINSYLEFVESGQLLEEYPDAAECEVRIELVCKYQPNEEGLNFFSLAAPVLESAGLKFEWSILNDN